MELYVTHKVYDKPFGDLVPHIMSEASCLNLFIIKAQSITLGPDVSLQDIHLFRPSSDLPLHDTPVIIIETGDHYDGFTPIVEKAWPYVLLNINDKEILYI